MRDRLVPVLPTEDAMDDKNAQSAGRLDRAEPTGPGAGPAIPPHRGCKLAIARRDSHESGAPEERKALDGPYLGYAVAAIAILIMLLA